MDDSIEDTEDAAVQFKSRNYDHLKPWQFKPGQSGNPAGKKPGTISLKEYAKKYLRDLTDEEKLAFMKGLDKDKIWEMAEGKAAQDGTLDVKGGLVISFDNAFVSAPEEDSE